MHETIERLPLTNLERQLLRQNILSHQKPGEHLSDFARRVRLATDTVYRLNNLQWSPRVATLRQLARILECSMDDFFAHPEGQHSDSDGPSV